MLIKLKHLVMELCVMLEGFCLWNVCIKNNKISETNIGLSIVSLYFLGDLRSLSLDCWLKRQKTFCGFDHCSGNHFKVTTAANKNYELFILFESGLSHVNSLCNKLSILYNSRFHVNNPKLLLWLLGILLTRERFLFYRCFLWFLVL